MTPEAKALERGTVVDVIDAAGSAVGTAIFNPNTLISARLLTTHAFADIDADWLAVKIGQAVVLRDRLFSAPFYRLIHAEADGLPGLVVDRYGDICVVQISDNDGTADQNLPARKDSWFWEHLPWRQVDYVSLEVCGEPVDSLLEQLKLTEALVADSG